MQHKYDINESTTNLGKCWCCFTECRYYLLSLELILNVALRKFLVWTNSSILVVESSRCTLSLRSW